MRNEKTTKSFPILTTAENQNCTHVHLSWSFFFFLNEIVFQFVNLVGQQLQWLFHLFLKWVLVSKTKDNFVCGVHKNLSRKQGEIKNAETFKRSQTNPLRISLSDSFIHCVDQFAFHSLPFCCFCQLVLAHDCTGLFYQQSVGKLHTCVPIGFWSEIRIQ